MAHLASNSPPGAEREASAASVRVSICIPAYQSAPLLPETLASIRQQTFTNWELIVTEDGSHDATEELVAQFATEGPQPVRFWRHPTNRGLAANRNAGLAEARGCLIAFLDADDLWLPSHLAECVAVIERERVGMVFAGCEIFDGATGTMIAHRTPEPQALARFALALHENEIVIQPSAVMVRRETVEAVGLFDPAFPNCNDLEYWLRICRSGQRIAFTGGETVRYRKHLGSMSQQSADLIADLAAVLVKHADWPEIPANIRRRAIRRHFLNASRINRRSRPVLALRQLAQGLFAPWRVVA